MAGRQVKQHTEITPLDGWIRDKIGFGPGQCLNASDLLRYRTGDLARFLPEPCLCGSSLRRLGRVKGRIAGRVQLSEGDILTLPDMDEVLFKVPGLL